MLQKLLGRQPFQVRQVNLDADFYPCLFYILRICSPTYNVSLFCLAGGINASEINELKSTSNNPDADNAQLLEDEMLAQALAASFDDIDGVNPTMERDTETETEKLNGNHNDLNSNWTVAGAKKRNGARGKRVNTSNAHKAKMRAAGNVRPKSTLNAFTNPAMKRLQMDVSKDGGKGEQSGSAVGSGA